jgi:hypothetical protein
MTALQLIAALLRAEDLVVVVVVAEVRVVMTRLVKED